MTQTNQYWANKLKNLYPAGLPEFWAYIQAAGANSEICGQSAYYWALSRTHKVNGQWETQS